MDSGNSGSLQSSSGGDEEYDSRADSFSAFMTKTAAAGHITQLSQPPQTAANAAMFSPLLSNYFDPTLTAPAFADQNSIPLLNLDMAWSRTLRSDPCSPQINPSAVLPSAGPSAHQKLGAGAGGFNGLSFPSTAEAHVSGSVTAAEAHVSGSVTAAGKDHGGRVMRNPKKRSRASRRAPTTVLTTDTTNFRAMVQEFTGIPAPPFTSSPFPRTRFDIFGTPSALRSAATPPYLRRPFPQKLQQPQPPQPFLPPPPSSLPSSSTNNLFSIPHNSILSSLFQSSPNEFGSVNTALTALPSLISPDQPARRSETGYDQLQTFSNNNAFSSPRNGEINGNQNIPSASSNFLGDKAPENVTGRGGEGMTESWICSSDLK
nr:rho GTPase-activating protein gacK-like [Ipomoea batatas]